MFRRLLSLTVSAVLLISSPATADVATPPVSMASLGDSITRGFNACGWFSDCLSRSWSTGDDSGVASHYLRIRTREGRIAGRNHNDARTGAKVDALAGQAQTAAARGVDYVTILIGANDACTSSESAMTPVATFRSRVDAALNILKSDAPDARVLIVSIPDLKRLWEVGRANSSARSTWSMFGICQSMLARPASTAPADAARRDRVRQRVADYNAQFAAACASYGPNCRFDQDAVFSYPFTLGQLTTWDYFHPNLSGQRILAEISYRNGFGW